MVHGRSLRCPALSCPMMITESLAGLNGYFLLVMAVLQNRSEKGEKSVVGGRDATRESTFRADNEPMRVDWMVVVGQGRTVFGGTERDRRKKWSGNEKLLSKHWRRSRVVVDEKSH